MSFRLQFYGNRHIYLAWLLAKATSNTGALDNAYRWIADFEQAQKLPDEFRVEFAASDEFADRYCPVVEQFGLICRWSLDQVQFATDIVLQR